MQIIPVNAKELIDVLAADNGGELDFKGVVLLCSVWNVQPVIVYPQDGGRSYYDWVATIQALARRVKEENS